MTNFKPNQKENHVENFDNYHELAIANSSNIFKFVNTGDAAFDQHSELKATNVEEISTQLTNSDRSFDQHTELAASMGDTVSSLVTTGDVAFDQHCERRYLMPDPYPSGNLTNPTPAPLQAPNISPNAASLHFDIAKQLASMADFRRDGDTLFCRINEELCLFYPLSLKGDQERDFARFVCTIMPPETTRSLKTGDFRELFNTISRFSFLSPGLEKAPDNLIRLCNGVLDILTGEFSTEVDQSLCFTRAISANWLAPETPLLSDDVQAYFDNLGNIENGSSQEQFLAMFGLACSNYRRMKVCAFIFGPRDNGKSTAVRLLQQLQIGGGTGAVSLRKFSSKFDLGTLRNCLLSVDADYDSLSTLGPASISILKKITGGDAINIEQKHVQPEVRTLETFPVFFGNDLPKIPQRFDPEGAFSRRLWYIPCGPAIPESMQDRKLGDKLWAERDTIVTIALQAAMRFIKDPSSIWRPPDEKIYTDVDPLDIALKVFFEKHFEWVGPEKYVHVNFILTHFFESNTFPEESIEGFSKRLRRVCKIPKDTFKKRDGVSSVLGLKAKSLYLGGWS